MPKSKLSVAAEIAQVMSIPLMFVIYLFPVPTSTTADQAVHWWSFLVNGRIPWLAILVILVAAVLQMSAVMLRKNQGNEKSGNKLVPSVYPPIREDNFTTQIELLESTVRKVEGERQDLAKQLAEQTNAANVRDGMLSETKAALAALKAKCMPEQSATDVVHYGDKSHEGQIHQQKLQLKALQGEIDRRRAAGAEDAAEIERLKRILDNGEFFIKLSGNHKFKDGRQLQAGGVVWRPEDIEELKRFGNFEGSVSFPLVIPNLLNQAREYTGAIQGELNACETLLAGAKGDLEHCRRRMHWFEFKYEATPKVSAALGRIPTVKLQYYTGQENRELAVRVANRFRDAGWDVPKPVETGSTNLANAEKGARIMLTYENSQIGVLHDPTQSLEFAAIRGYGLFDPEKIVRTVHENIGADLLITIFPKTFWD